jgi:hypothetical protein
LNTSQRGGGAVVYIIDPNWRTIRSCTLHTAGVIDVRKVGCEFVHGGHDDGRARLSSSSSRGFPTKFA